VGLSSLQRVQSDWMRASTRGMSIRSAPTVSLTGIGGGAISTFPAAVHTVPVQRRQREQCTEWDGESAPCQCSAVGQERGLNAVERVRCTMWAVAQVTIEPWVPWGVRVGPHGV
jgi:hypothetical protein